MSEPGRMIRMPSLGAEMEEGTLLEWYVKPGDPVRYGQVIALLDTEKAEIEMESFETGTIETLLLEPGQTVSVGEAIATLADAEEARVTPEPPSAATTTAPPKPREVTDSRQPEPPEVVPPVAETPRVHEPPQPRIHEPSPPRVRATPLARRLARDRGVDVSRLVGSGAHGVIVEADVLAAGKAAPEAGPTPDAAASRSARPAQPSSGRAEAESANREERRREIIAAAMVRSKREIPHYYLSTRISVDPLQAWLARQNAARTAADRIAMPAFLLCAVARAVRRFPEMNGHQREDGFQPADSVHLGVVVSLRTGGIVVPTLRDADRFDPDEMMCALRDVVARARAGRLRSSELGTATITVTSLGEEGAEAVFGVVYPPQVAIVGFGGVYPGLRVDEGLIGAQSQIQATLAADHRVSDGQRGSRFLREIGRLVENPEAS